MPRNVPSKWVLQQVFEILMFDVATEECQGILNDLKNTTLEMSGDTVYAQGGVGNPKILGFGTNKAAKMTIESATFSNESIAAQLGQEPVVGANANYKVTDIFKATSATAATLAKTPVGDVEFIYKLNADGTLGTAFTQVESAPSATEFTVSTKTVTFGASSGLAADDELVAFYHVTTPANTVTISNYANVFGKILKLVCNSLVKDTVTGEDFAAQLIIYKAKMSDSFTLGTTADGEPSVQNVEAEALVKSSADPKLWDLIILDQEALT